MTDVTRYRNRYVRAKIYNNVTFMVKFLVAKKALKEILDYISENNGKICNTDLFRKRTVALTRGIPL